MDRFKKPPADSKALFKKWCFTIILLAVGVGLIVFSFYEMIRYRKVSKEAVVLTATVVRVERSYTEDTDYYDPYVEYTYDGKKYTIQYISSIDEKWLQKVGTQVDITINPNQPTEQLKDMVDSIFFSMFFGLPAVFAAGIFSGRRVCPTYVQTYGVCEETVRKDLESELRRKRLWIILTLMPIILFIHGFCMVGIDSIAFGEILLAFGLCIISVPACIYFVKEYRNLNKQHASNLWQKM